MKKIKLLLLCLVIGMLYVSHPVVAQKKGDKLKVETSLFGNKFYKGVWNITQDKTINILSENGECFELINKGIKLQRTFRILAGTGTAMIAYSAISAAAGADDPRWYIAGIGGGIILVSIPIYSTGNKRVNEAIEVYNEEELSAYRGSQFIDHIKLVGTGHGVGLQVRF